MQVNFLTKLVALKPGKTVQEMIKNVMEGKNEGADDASSDEEDTTGRTSGIAGRVGIIQSITRTCACWQVCFNREPCVHTHTPTRVKIVFSFILY